MTVQQSAVAGSPMTEASVLSPIPQVQTQAVLARRWGEVAEAGREKEEAQLQQRMCSQGEAVRCSAPPDSKGE